MVQGIIESAPARQMPNRELLLTLPRRPQGCHRVAVITAYNAGIRVSVSQREAAANRAFFFVAQRLYC
jgi:hypothetical protein